MSIEKFRLIFAGERMRGGAMDVYELAPALLGLADLVRDSNRLLNGDRAEVNVSVDADFIKSSFEVQLLLDQTVLHAAHETLDFLSTVDARTLLDHLFGTVLDHGDKLIEGTVLGLLAIYSALKGKKPKPENVTIKDNHGTIVIDQRTIHSDARSVQLYMNDPIRSDVDRLVLPLAKDGVDDLTVSREGRTLDRVRKEDLPPRVIALDEQNESVEHVLENTREALVKVATANFEEGKWRFSDGSSKFSAKIADPLFQEKLDSREEGFYKGDLLRVVLESKQTEKTNGRIQIEHTIREVLEHRRTGEQRPLFPKQRGR
jgi:hypothetical protein